MPIRQRGDSWQIDVRVAGQRYREDYPTQTQAIERDAEIRLASAKGLPVPTRRDVRSARVESQGRTLQEALDLTYEDAWKGAKAGEKQRLVAVQVLSYFGPGTPLRAVDDAWVQRYIADLSKARNSDATINRKLAALSKMFSVAYSKRWVTADERPIFKRRTEQTRRELVVSHEDEERIVSTARVVDYHDLADLVVVLADTGARPWTEIPWGLEWTSVNFKAGTLTIFGRKNPTGGIVNTTLPMTPRVREILERRLKSGLAKPFPYRTYREMNVEWERVRALLGRDGDPGFVMYALRHTCGVRLAEAGHTLTEIANYLGHSRTSTTERYARHMTAHSLNRLRDSLARQTEEAKPGRLIALDGGKQASG